MPSTLSRRFRAPVRIEPLRFERGFADRTAAAIAALVVLATVSVVAATSAVSERQAQELAVLTSR
jgi:hypothetical protein